jgi:SNF2 family DNA or RNA helicase
MIEETKFRVGKYKIPVKLNHVKGEIEIHSGFNRSLIAEIKVLSGAKWHGHDKLFPRKIWTINDDEHNHFQLRWLKGENPYERYDAPLLPFERKPRFNTSLGRDVLPYEHQNEFTRILITRHYAIIAGEMGTGKTLSVIEAMEWANQNAPWATGNRWDGLEHPLFWYVAPKSVLRTIERELRIWQSGIWPQLITYDRLVRMMKDWPQGQSAPPFVVFDESSKIKNHTAQRSQAAKALADGVRKDWGDNGWVIELSGTPAPRAPDDWWHQCEVACPGFLKEGDIYKFRNRLGVIEQRESTITGGIFPQLITWRDDDRKCAKCGKLNEDVVHHPNGDVFGEANFHTFVPGKNEVKLLYERMKGLVHVKMKKDCLDLPDKTYREIVIEPKPDILRASKLIVKSSRTVIEGLSRLRELSDGFQYQERKGRQEAMSRMQRIG